MAANTGQKQHTPQVNLRIPTPLREALESYGERNGIGNLSATIRFACASLLRTDGALPNKPEARKAS